MGSLGAVGGVDLSRYFGLEIAGDFYQGDVEADGFGKIREFTIFTVIPQARVRYPLYEDRLVPYLTAGVGLGFSEDNDRTVLGASATAPTFDAKDSSVAWSFGGGIDWFVSPNLAFGVDARYLWHQGDADLNGRPIELDLDSALVSAGLRFYFPEMPKAGGLTGVEWRRTGPDDVRGYLALRVGYFGPETGGAFFTDKQSESEAFLETPSGEALGTAALGVSLGRYWSIELASDFVETEIQTPALGKAIEVSLYTALAQLRLTYPVLEDRLTPYLVAGGGVGFAELNDRRKSFEAFPIDGDRQSSLIGSAGFGLEYAVLRNLSLGFEVKQLFGYDVDFEVRGEPSEFHMDATLVSLGVRLFYP
jgi:opacity protein-like surface antigen